MVAGFHTETEQETTPAVIVDDLQLADASAPATEGSTLSTSDASAGTRRRPRLVLPGGGRWPWWGWALYLLIAGPLLLVAAVPAAVLRLVLPTRWNVWGFRRRRTAARYLAVIVILVGAGAAIGSRQAAAETLASALRLWATSAPAGWPVGGVPAATTEAGGAVLDPATPGSPPPQATVPPGEAAAPVTADQSQGEPSEPAAAATPSPHPPAPTPQPTTPPPRPTVTTPAVVVVQRRVVVGNTGGLGVALRRSPRWDDRIPGVAWPDRTVLVVLQDGITGDDGAGGTTSWLRVRGPGGQEGFVPARYVVPS
ncbi:MAG: hypothetical protein ACRDJN_27420 [Chloroflexota bacterium]